jgi:signal transduction histidine kinase
MSRRTSAPPPVTRPVAAPPRARVGTPALGIWLNLAAAAVVGVSVLALDEIRQEPVVLAVAVVALLAWVGWALAPAGRRRTALQVVAVIAGSVGVGGTQAVLVAVVIAAIIPFTAEPARRLPPIVGLVVASAVLCGASDVAAHRSAEFLLSVGASLAIAVLIGFTRRQRTAADQRERELLARSLETERETARADLLAERAAVARDIHDVLAHSLGGLVIQLDAVGALLEGERYAEAASRVEQARRLAADGLTEARRAVAALRDPATGADTAPPDDAVADLIATHRALGAAAELEGDPSLAGLDPRHRDALTRMVQEALSNARRHSPGAVSRISVRREPGVLLLRVATPLASSPPESTSAGGHGLIGMQERFAALGDGSSVAAGPDGQDFVVAGRVVLA